MVGEGDRVAIVLQDDPDPDAMASAMALRTLLGRNKQTTPFFAFKPVTRPENRTMVHLLEIEIQPATTEELRDFDKIAMVDVQPPYFGEKIPRADIAIDHHPGYPGGAAPFEDVRTKYGATATIMTEYLVTADEKISERLATALLYGIRSDTLALVAARDRRRPAGVRASLPARQLQPAAADRSSRAAAQFRANPRARDEAAGSQGSPGRAQSRHRRARRPDRADGGLLPAVRRRVSGSRWRASSEASSSSACAITA